MRYIFVLTIALFFASCVSSKKYRNLESEHNKTMMDVQDLKKKNAECGLLNQVLEQKVANVLYENQLKDLSIESCKKENIHKEARLKDMEAHLGFVKSSNEELTKRIDGLSASNKVNVDIMKKLLEEQEVQQLKVLNLSLALQKQDSLNIHLVKKSKRNISDDKLKRTLEKLGFVFF